MLGQKSNSTSDLKIKPAATETALNCILDDIVATSPVVLR